jgi:hypothetical protein
VDAVIPTTGRPELRRAVESVLAQDVPVHPIVVLDRPEVLANVTEALSGLNYTIRVTGGAEGGSVARNLGVSASAADYVAFLDDDDEWLPAKTSTQLRLMDADAISASCCRTELVGTSSRVVPDIIYDGSMPMIEYLLDRSTMRLKKHYLQSSSLIVSSEVARRFSWDTTLRRHQDWSLFIEMSRAGLEIATAEQALVRVFQQTANSISVHGDWKDSLRWLNGHDQGDAGRSAGDFLGSVVLRSALRSREWSASFRLALLAFRRGAHLSALLVGASGVQRRR